MIDFWLFRTVGASPHQSCASIGRERMAVEIPLNLGYVALIDEEDEKRVRKYEWISHKRDNTVYARMRHVRIPDHHRSLHRYIVKAPRGVNVDHINGNGLDNRRSNLRLCSHAQNLRNRKARSSEALTSKFKGVSLSPSNTWRASIGYNGKNIYLGSFKTEIDAALAYDRAALKWHGEFARTNAMEFGI